MIDVLYEDSHIVAVNKPAGVYVHPSPGHEHGTLTGELVRRYPECANVGSPERPGVVHRLDAGTTGVVLFARTRQAYLKLREMFESHREIKKTYLAVLHGAPKQRTGTLKCNIDRKPWDPRRMAIVGHGGKHAVTHWCVLSKKGPLALVEFKIETGRTHQIRLAAASLGCPIAGDDLYGDAAKDRRLRTRPGHLLLHAVSLEFPHPASGVPLAISAPPPEDFIYAC